MNYTILMIIIISLIIIALISIYLYFENNAIQITNIDVKSPTVPDSFNDFTIVHISDLHNKDFGKGQNNIIDKIREANPDIIVVTGDISDSYDTHVDSTAEYINGISNIAHVY